MCIRTEHAHYAVFHPRVLAAQHLLGNFVHRAVVTAVEVVEQLVDAPPRLAAEQVGEGNRLLAPFLRQRVRANTSRTHREELRPDIDAAKQDELPTLELRA